MSELERAVLLVIKQKGDDLPDLPAEFWHAALALRARGLVKFCRGMWAITPLANENLPAVVTEPLQMAS